jgi:hypothetical protein
MPLPRRLVLNTHYERTRNYASDYRDVDGIIVPTKRRVYAYEGDYPLVKEPLLVAIDMDEVTLL